MRGDGPLGWWWAMQVNAVEADTDGARVLTGDARGAIKAWSGPHACIALVRYTHADQGLVRAPCVYSAC